MKIANNYKSVVVIGGFNPTILTPSFLEKCCGYTSEHKPSGQTTPVASEMKFGNTHFLMELNKFQVSVQNPNSLEEVFPLDLAVKYLQVLEYTPLQMFGINYNYSLSEMNIDALRKLLSDPWTTGDKLGIEPLRVALNIHRPNGKGLTIQDITVVDMLDDSIKHNLRITIEDEGVMVNNNFEVVRLDEERERINIIPDRYDDLVKSNNEFLDQVRGVCE